MSASDGSFEGRPWFLKAEIAEDLAVRWAFELADLQGLREIEVETGSLLLVDAFRGTREPSFLEMLAMDLQSLAATFLYFSFTHVSAKHGCGYFFSVCFSFAGPLLQLAAADFTHFSAME